MKGPVEHHAVEQGIRQRSLDTITLAIQVSTRKKQRALCIDPQGTFVIWLMSTPSENRANEELLRFLAEIFSISRNQVTILRGAHSRHKVIAVKDLDKSTAIAVLLARAKPA